MIHSYRYKPAPIFYRSDEERLNGREMYFGVECELDFPSANARDNFDAQIQDEGIADRIYLKHDGSLGPYGVEIVSFPMTLIEHNNYHWERILKIAQGLGARGHDSEKCGIHVHVNRSWFCNTEIKKAMALFDVHVDKFYPFTRRRSRYHYNRFAPTYGLGNYNDIASRQRLLNREFKRNNKREYAGERYRNINIVNEHTVEFRFFQSTTKYESFIACIEMVDKMCRWTKGQNLNTCLSDESYDMFIKHTFEQDFNYIYLARYLHERIERKSLTHERILMQGTRYAENNCAVNA